MSYQPSIRSRIAERAAVRLGHRRSPTSSRLRVAKNDSARALSQHRPVRPTGRRTAKSLAGEATWRLVRWQPRSVWKITGPVGRPHRAGSPAGPGPAEQQLAGPGPWCGGAVGSDGAPARPGASAGRPGVGRTGHRHTGARRGRAERTRRDAAPPPPAADVRGRGEQPMGTARDSCPLHRIPVPALADLGLPAHGQDRQRGPPDHPALVERDLRTGPRPPPRPRRRPAPRSLTARPCRTAPFRSGG